MAAPIPFSQQEPEVSFERHYSAEEIAELWGLSAKVVRELFEDEPGVIRIGNRVSTGRKRKYVTLKVPSSIVARVHTRLCRGDASRNW